MTEKQKFKILREAAEVSDFGFGAWAYDTWSKYNEQYFAGALKVGGIFWGLIPHGHALGFFSPNRNAITLHTSLVDPRGSIVWHRPSKIFNEVYAADVLLHEMIHQSIHQKGLAEKDSHNCESWCNEIKRLSPMVLGREIKAEPVLPRRIKGKVQRQAQPGFLSRAEISTWPYTLRPKGYYLRKK